MFSKYMVKYVFSNLFIAEIYVNFESRESNDTL